MVKVASETIASGNFYSQFFDLIERYLDSTVYPNESDTEKRAEPVPAKNAAPASPPAQSVTGTQSE